MKFTFGDFLGCFVLVSIFIISFFYVLDFIRRCEDIDKK